jgi:hypothetical protein
VAFGKFTFTYKQTPHVIHCLNLLTSGPVCYTHNISSTSHRKELGREREEQGKAPLVAVVAPVGTGRRWKDLTRRICSRLVELAWRRSQPGGSARSRRRSLTTLTDGGGQLQRPQLVKVAHDARRRPGSRQSELSATVRGESAGVARQRRSRSHTSARPRRRARPPVGEIVAVLSHPLVRSCRVLRWGAYGEPATKMSETRREREKEKEMNQYVCDRWQVGNFVTQK